MKLSYRDPIPTRILAMGGDSIVTESGPFQSILRPGQMVTTRTLGHYKGDAMTGTFEAHYASGDVLRGKAAATRRKQRRSARGVRVPPHLPPAAPPSLMDAPPPPPPSHPPPPT